MTCTHRLADGPLVCSRTDDHEPGHGCTYESTTVRDGRHDDEGTDW